MTMNRINIDTLPVFPIPEQYKDADDALRGKVYWHLKDLVLNENEEYVERVEKELSMVRERNCANYFLLVSDLCEKVWEQGGVVGPGRGTSASLLINWLLGITEVNPMDLGLVPERFFPYNIDMLPCICIDFDEKGYRIAESYCEQLKPNFYILDVLRTAAMADVATLDDKETLELFAKGDTDGVFQFDSEGIKEWLRLIQPDNFEQIVALYEMYCHTPGERISLYSQLKKGQSREIIDNPFTDLHGLTDETFGMIIYREQLMQIVSTVASFSHEDQRTLCMFAGPYRVDILDELGKKFLDGGLANGYDKNALMSFWDGFVRSDNAACLINKAHCVSYTLTAYRCAYLKAHNCLPHFEA